VQGNYLVYWDIKRNAMAVNEGANGMQKVDFLMAEAKKRHLFLIIDFIDFWDYTGGAQQMRAWYGIADKNQFFVDPRISQDPNHLVASGNANPTALNITTDLATPSIDFTTWHGYPLYVNLTPEPFDERITQFCHLVAGYHKPLLMEEFGWARKNSTQAGWYANWLNTVRHEGGAGWLVWRLVSHQADGKYPVDDFDQFDIHNDGTQIWRVLKEAMQPAPVRQVDGNCSPGVGARLG
jgi:mannan endo-1,4-beta-mannosidase